MLCILKLLVASEDATDPSGTSLRFSFEASPDNLLEKQLLEDEVANAALAVAEQEAQVTAAKHGTVVPEGGAIAGRNGRRVSGQPQTLTQRRKKRGDAPPTEAEACSLHKVLKLALSVIEHVSDMTLNAAASSTFLHLGTTKGWAERSES